MLLLYKSQFGLRMSAVTLQLLFCVCVCVFVKVFSFLLLFVPKTSAKLILHGFLHAT